jgi:hypothetical protein
MKARRILDGGRVPPWYWYAAWVSLGFTALTVAVTRALYRQAIRQDMRERKSWARYGERSC